MSTLFPYTTLFRSNEADHAQDRRREHSPAIGLVRSEEHTSELQSRQYLVCRLLLEKKKRAIAARREGAEGGRDMSQLDTYLFFDGTCREAMQFFERTLGGKLEVIFFFNDTATTEIYTLSLHDALPI